MKQLVLIKGKRDGLSIQLSDDAAFDDVMVQLEDLINQNDFDTSEALMSISIETGNRILTETQERTLRDVVKSKNKLVIQAIQSNVITKEKALKLKEESDIHMHHRTVRSGQVIEMTGDLFVLGDINPGGMVKATGNVFVLGALKGIAHAGCDGNRDAIIAASLMNPVQLRIADLFSRAPDYESDGVYMECGYVNEGSIVIDRIAEVLKKRQTLNGFERSVLNG